MNDLGLSQLVKQPTHIEPTPTLLDLIITNMTDVPAPVIVLPQPAADHLPVLLSAPVRRQRPPAPCPAYQPDHGSVLTGTPLCHDLLLNRGALKGRVREARALPLGRTGEMIPEVEGTRPWGPPRKRVPMCLKGPKITYTTIAIAEKQSKRSKKGPFSVIYWVPLVSPRKWNLWGPEGKVPPGPPGFSGHALGT